MEINSNFVFQVLLNDWLVVSTPWKNISQNGNLPQIGVKKIFETTTQISILGL